MTNIPSSTLTLDPAENVDTSTSGCFVVGFEFTVNAAASVTGCRFYATRALTGVVGYLWSAVGTIAAQSASMDLVQGWNEMPFQTPVTVQTGTTYQIGIRQTPDVGNGVYYTASTVDLSDATFGPISTPATAGRYSYNQWTGRWCLPGEGTAGASPAWFGVDLVTGAAPSTGATITLNPAAAAITGQPVSLSAATRITGDTPGLTLATHPITMTGSQDQPATLTLGQANLTIAGQPVTVTTGSRLHLAAATLTVTAHKVRIATNTYTPATNPTGTVTAPDLHTEAIVGTLTTGDYGYPIGGQALDGDQPHDCTGTTGELHVRRTDGTVLISDVTWTDAATGEWSYTLRDGDLTVPGAYSLEIQVSVGDTVVQTFPGGSLQVREQYDA